MALFVGVPFPFSLLARYRGFDFLTRLFERGSTRGLMAEVVQDVVDETISNQSEDTFLLRPEEMKRV